MEITGKIPALGYQPELTSFSVKDHDGNRVQSLYGPNPMRMLKLYTKYELAGALSGLSAKVLNGRAIFNTARTP